MNDNPIIKSILDNDFYKFTMQNAVLQLFLDLKVRYRLHIREAVDFPLGFEIEVKNHVEMMEKLSLTKDEKEYLKNSYSELMSDFYFDFLENYRFNPDEVNIFIDEENHLQLEIEGLWLNTILWEVPLMAIISELYFLKTGQEIDIYNEIITDNDLEKCRIINKNKLKISEFGTRRRYSFANHERIIGLLKINTGENLTGTSNVYFAFQNNLKPIGTLAHEWFMVHAALYGYLNANRTALENWLQIYNGKLGIALSDTYTTDNFLINFNKNFADKFAGVRQDSGNPFDFAEKIINKYKSHHIEPLSKTIVFSDNLNIETAAKINTFCHGRINAMFGIGTNLTNDIGVKPLNMVIKISSVKIDKKWIDTVKLTDDSGKESNNSEETENCKKILKLEK